jgi:ABC-type antimicrobial peptide transport system ATPase subunit
MNIFIAEKFFIFRLSTVADADIVIVMNEGELIEMGSPKDLLFQDNSTFRELALAGGESNLQILQNIAINGFKVKE